MITSSTFEMGDPWKVLSESEMILYDDEMPRSPFELAYQAIQFFSIHQHLMMIEWIQPLMNILICHSWN